MLASPLKDADRNRFTWQDGDLEPVGNEDDEKRDLIADLVGGWMGRDDAQTKSLMSSPEFVAKAAQHGIGEVWQVGTRYWPKRPDGRTVPAKNPNAVAKQPKPRAAKPYLKP